MNIEYPFHIDPLGRTASNDDDAHIRDLIEQVLFTTPGERVNRPTFGSGLLRLLFAPNSGELAATSQLLVQASLQEWLGDLLRVDAVTVQASDESTIQVNVSYTVARDQRRRVAQFTRKV